MNENIKCKNIQEYKNNCFLFFSMFFLTIMLGTYVLAYKMVLILGFTFSAGIFIFPINYAITDIVTEIFGFSQTKKLIKLAFICCLFFAITIPLLSIVQHPPNWHYQSSYSYVLGNVFRFFIANTIGILVGIIINSYVIGKLKFLLQGKHFALRSICSSIVGELITSIIADILAFAGKFDSQEIIKIMMGIFLIKVIYALFLAVPNSLIVTHIKYKSGMLQINNDFLIEQDSDEAKPSNVIYI